MNKNDKFTITLKIVGLEFKPRILRSEEELYRQAERQINEAFNAYLKKYGDINREAILIALALQFAVKNLKTERQLINLLQQLNEESIKLEEFLNTQ